MSLFSAQERHQQDTESSSGGQEKIPGGLVKVVFISVDGTIHRLLEKISVAKRDTKMNVTYCSYSSRV